MSQGSGPSRVLCARGSHRHPRRREKTLLEAVRSGDSRTKVLNYKGTAITVVISGVSMGKYFTEERYQVLQPHGEGHTGFSVGCPLLPLRPLVPSYVGSILCGSREWELSTWGWGEGASFGEHQADSC